MSLSIKNRINNALLKKGILSHKDLKKAIDIQKAGGGALSDILIREKFVKKDVLTSILSQELGIPTINLTRYKIDRKILNIIPKETALQYKILPLSQMGGVLTIAMADPLNVFVIDDIKALTGYKIGIVITRDSDMGEAIERYYSADVHEAVEKIIENIEEAKKIETINEDVPPEDVDSEALIKLTQEAPIVKITKMLLEEGIALRASDILIEPLERETRERYRVDGMLKDGRHPPKTMHAAIISRLKVMASLNIAERRLPQDGRFKIKSGQKQVDFRISVLPSSFGEKAALRILDKSRVMLNLDKLGFEKGPLEILKESSKKPHGMILACGPTGCGKTTTLYSVLKNIDTPEKNIITVEDPVEYDLPGINQVTVQPHIGLTFASTLRSILRQDPDVIMVGEIRDVETVDIAIKAALTGHMVLSTLHTTTASGSIVRMMDMGVEPFLISSAIIMVAAQRLVRAICPRCRQKYSADESLIMLLGAESFLKPPVTLYKGKGCKWCDGTGYKGRVGIIETLRMTPSIKELIAGNSQEALINEQARAEGMKTLRESGLIKAMAGITTLEEVVRVTTGEADAAGEVDEKVA